MKKTETRVGFIYFVLNDLLNKEISFEEAKQILLKNRFHESEKNTYETRGILVKIEDQKKISFFLEIEPSIKCHNEEYHPNSSVVGILNRKEALRCLFSLLEKFIARKITIKDVMRGLIVNGFTYNNNRFTFNNLKLVFTTTYIKLYIKL